MFFAHAPTRVHEVHDLHDFSAVHGLQEAVFRGYHANHANHAERSNHAGYIKPCKSCKTCKSCRSCRAIKSCISCKPCMFAERRREQDDGGRNAASLSGAAGGRLCSPLSLAALTGISTAPPRGEPSVPASIAAKFVVRQSCKQVRLTTSWPPPTGVHLPRPPGEVPPQAAERGAVRHTWPQSHGDHTPFTHPVR